MQSEISQLSTQTTDPAALQPALCENCGTQLLGRYCHACGQLAQGAPRHFHDVLSDFTDVVINVDGRLFSSIGPLYLRPGKLTLDYFAGKRRQYLPPFRLVFFLAVVAFIAAQLTTRLGFTHMVHVNQTQTSSAGKTSSKPYVAPKDDPNGAFSDGNIRFNGYVLWNRQTKPLQVGWLPDAVNGWANDRIGNAQQQLHAMNSGTPETQQEAKQQWMLGALSAAPIVLIVFLPIFALLLKIFYIFKKRLYMEHLIVAMYSHAFLLLSMLVLILLSVLRHALPHTGGWGALFSVLETAAWIWILVYLFRMQKRVYRQGWFLTTLKYWCIGWCYLILAGLGWSFAMLLSLTGA